MYGIEKLFNLSSARQSLGITKGETTEMRFSLQGMKKPYIALVFQVTKVDQHNVFKQ